MEKCWIYNELADVPEEFIVMEKMLFCIVHFNTPDLTTCACASIKKQHPSAKIIIFDNSDKYPFTNSDLFDATYIDNTKGQLINFDKELAKYHNKATAQQMRCGVNFGSAKHSMSIQWLIDHLDEDFILCDSDILLKKPIDFSDRTKLCVADVDKKWISHQVVRIHPFIAYINVPLLKKHKINFFDGQRMHGLCSSGRYVLYDTGASFFEDINVCDKNLFKQINYNDYIIHFKAGSWKQFDKGKLLEYKDLWQ